MKVNNNKGFTLVELIATIVVLSLIVGVAGVSVVAIMNGAKQKEMNLLVDEIKSGAETYYQECRYAKSESLVCPAATIEGGLFYYEVSLGDLVKYGFLDGNAEDKNDKYVLVNPNTKKKISNCMIKYTFYNGNFVFAEVNNSDKNCPDVR